jgi:glycosyltransferase involved in cell wall biosynthesis
MISILLATFNGHKFIEESINSILNQSFNDFELLIGLNGENEATKNILKNYNDNRIKIFDYGNDKGKSKTLNKLLQVAKYDWVGIQDDDDVWLPQKLETQIKFIEHFDVIGSLINYISESGKIIGSPNLAINHDEIKIKSLSGDNNIANTSAIFKKECALEVNGWSTNLDGIEDFDFWLKLIRNNKKIINVNEVLVLHRLHGKSNFNTKKHDINSILC